MDRSIKVNFHKIGDIPEVDLKFVVLQARFKNQWIFVRHKDRETWEIPGGHIEREQNETPDQAARRELIEETGAEDFQIEAICEYSVSKDGVTSYGRLYYCNIESLGQLGPWEIEEIMTSNSLPRPMTYEAIQPHLFEKVVIEKANDL